MSDYYFEDYVEPERAFTLKDGVAEVKIQFNAETMELAASELIQRHIEANFIPKLERAISDYLKLNGHSDFGEMIKNVIRDEFEKRYPDVVENKVNEVHQFLLNLKPEDARDWRWSNDGKNIADKARLKVQEYIEKELSKEIKVTKEYLEQFSRNYFANNLFKAMGLMDSMIPQVKGD